jgi:hypothetical protein
MPSGRRAYVVEGHPKGIYVGECGWFKAVILGKVFATRTFATFNQFWCKEVVVSMYACTHPLVGSHSRDSEINEVCLALVYENVVL